MRTMTMVGVLALVLGTGCGITGPRLHFGAAGSGTVAKADGPGIEGAITNPEGVTVVSGDLYLNPAALVADLLRYVGSLFNKGGAAAQSVAKPAAGA